ncbi:hypothetical protein BC792_102110 [Sphingobacterium allocomposti]|uniref:Uncharacterized protein n=1 Tax=Sphingobacterium allocomposti TaxID=415956 RepID=A0A5S5DQM9_9SPHI|nr:hypothetical protein BC792_102110 [Sphingobacterium composti Yoo et al. 2007 non Ten et al. 2007]
MLVSCIIVFGNNTRWACRLLQGTRQKLPEFLTDRKFVTPGEGKTQQMSETEVKWRLLTR